MLVVGDVMLDRYWWGSVSRISPEAPVPVIDLQRTSSIPGGAANVALNAASMGAKGRLVAAGGDDADGDELINELRSRRVDVSGVLRVAGRRTAVKTRIIAHSQQVARVDREQKDGLDESAWRELIRHLEDAAEGCGSVIVSDYAKGTLTPDVLAAVRSVGDERACPILIDPKGKDYRKYAGATILTPNKREAAEACKLEEFDPSVVEKAGAELLSGLGLRHVLITEGEHGMTLFSAGEEPFHLDATVHQVYDVTGAGDSVIACLGVAVAAGIPVRDACVLANAAGGVSVQHVGTHAVTIDELREEIAGASA